MRQNAHDEFELYMPFESLKSKHIKARKLMDLHIQSEEC